MANLLIIKTFKEFIFLYFYFDVNRQYLVKFSSDLKHIKGNDIHDQIISLDIDENSIYCLTHCSKNQIKIFDHELKNIKTLVN